MHYTSLIAFLSGELAPEIFAKEIAVEVTAFYADLEQTAQAYLPCLEGERFVMEREDARRFLKAVEARKMNNETATYIADCIVASDSIEFGDEETREAVFFLEDDSGRFLNDHNDGWLSGEVQKALARLE